MIRVEVYQNKNQKSISVINYTEEEFHNSAFSPEIKAILKCSYSMGAQFYWAGAIYDIKKVPDKEKSVRKGWVLVKVNGLIIDDVILFLKEDDAKEEFKDYTGVDYDDMIKRLNDGENIASVLKEEYDQTSIHEVGIPEG